MAALVLACLTACGNPTGGGAPAPGSGAKGERYAPDFALEDVHGKLVRLSDSTGRVRLVDFWATWCPPCLEEIPDFKELHATYADKGLTIIAIAMDDEGHGVVKPFVEKWKIPYTNVIGDEDVAGAFGGVVGLPTAFLVDRDGKVVATFVGGTPKKAFEKKIREMLGLEPTG